MQCGLCCTDALHNAAVLDPDEIAPARAFGLPVLLREPPQKPAFALPCPRLEGTICSIYPNRPRACVRYKCQLLLDLEDGATNFDDATAKVATAKALVDRAQGLMPEGMTLAGARRLIQETPANQPGPVERAGQMPLRLAITALSLYLDRHFRTARERKSLSLEPVAQSQPDTEMT